MPIHLKDVGITEDKVEEMAHHIAINKGLEEDFLYEAIFIPEWIQAPSRDIINQPELQVYLTKFGMHKGDYGLVAEVENKIIGAVWVRTSIIGSAKGKLCI